MPSSASRAGDLVPEKDLVEQRQVRPGVAKARGGAERGAAGVRVAEAARVGGDCDIEKVGLRFVRARRPAHR